MTFNPYEPYGPPVETTMRIVTWNVWGRYGEWAQRLDGIEDVLTAAAPDVVCLAEAWSTEESTQPAEIATRLGLGHHLFVGDCHVDGWTSGIGVVSRWPISTKQRRALPSDDGRDVGEALFVAIDGPRGVIQVFVVILDFPLYASAVRQGQVRQLAELIEEVNSSWHITVVCGDFNGHCCVDGARTAGGSRCVPALDQTAWASSSKAAATGEDGFHASTPSS